MDDVIGMVFSNLMLTGIGFVLGYIFCKRSKNEEPEYRQSDYDKIQAYLISNQVALEKQQKQMHETFCYFTKRCYDIERDVIEILEHNQDIIESLKDMWLVLVPQKVMHEPRLPAMVTIGAVEKRRPGRPPKNKNPLPNAGGHI